MSDSKAVAAQPHELTSEDLWALTTYDFEVTKGPGGRPCVFKMRRMDLVTQLMEDVVNAPLLTAALGIIQEVQEWIREEDGRNFESAFQNLSAENKRTVLEQMQRFACMTVLRPRLTREPEQDPGAFPVALLSAQTLLDIWKHDPPHATVPRLSEVAATDFRPAAGDGAGQPASPGDGLRAAAGELGAGHAATGEP